MSKVTDIYGSMVFNEHTMQERLPSATYKQLMRTIKGGEVVMENGVVTAKKGSGTFLFTK